MGFANSSLVNYTRISPNRGNFINGKFVGYARNHAIDTITIHHMAGNLSVETCGSVFAPSSRQASSNYGIDSNGRVGMYVEECDRSWCTLSPANDNRAVTIEVANDEIGGNWHVSDKALAKLIELCVDICKRNNIAKLVYTGDKTGNLTMHKWFASTSCPGPYLESKFPYIADEVNKKLTPPKTSTSTSIKKGDVVSIKSGATYYTGGDVPSWVEKMQWIVKEVSEDRAVIDKSSDGKNSINSPINTKYLTVVKEAKTETKNTFSPYLAKINTSALNIRKGAGTNYGVVRSIKDRGTYTIVSESSGKGSTKGWGKLKSGEGWISLDYVIKL